MTGSYVVLAGDGAWRVGVVRDGQATVVQVSVPDEADQAQVAQAVAECLAEQGYDHDEVVLAIPSSWCLCAAVETEGLPRKKVDQAMVYRLEENLPVVAEEVVADFMPATAGGWALGVCAQVAKLAPVVAALEEVGVVVDVICPTALLALQGEGCLSGSGDCDALVWADGDRWELFGLAGDRVTNWQLLPQKPQELTIQLGMVSLREGRPIRLAARCVQKAVLDGLAADSDVQVLGNEDRPMVEAAVLAAGQVLDGSQDAPVDLRRDGLEPSDPMRRVHVPLIGLLAAGLLLLMSLSGGMLWRAHRYHQFTTEFEGRQQVVFHELFPDRPVPVNIKSRLASTLRELDNRMGNHGAMPSQRSGLVMLREALGSLPHQLRFRILELRLDTNKLYLEGQARDHSTAEKVAVALDQQSSFRVEPPRTEKLSDQSIVFTITGSVVENDGGGVRVAAQGGM